MAIKEKGLLLVEQSYENLGASPICTRDETSFEHLFNFGRLLEVL